MLDKIKAPIIAIIIKKKITILPNSEIRLVLVMDCKYFPYSLCLFWAHFVNFNLSYLDNVESYNFQWPQL